MVRLDGADVFKSVDKTTCKVYVPKGMKDTYKANTYWSPFGNNIVEFGQLITSTSNNENYGWVEGSGAYEEGEIVTLKAVCQDGNWEDYYWAKYVNLFFGWYDGETKVSDDTIYTYKAGKEDKALSVNSCV